MGQRGPRKTPASVKKQRGTYRDDRDAEPDVPTDGSPPCPNGLHEWAEREYRRLTPLMVKHGLLSDVDWVAWYLLFDSLSLYCRAEDELASEQLVQFVGDSGYPAMNPLVSIRAKAWDQTVKACREFGLTPSARSGLKLDFGGQAEDDPFADHVKKGQQK